MLEIISVCLVAIALMPVKAARAPSVEEIRNPVAVVSDMWQINKLPHNHRIPHNNLHSLCFQMAMRTKAEFDREFILSQLPEEYEYVLNTWDVMGNRQFFVEGRVVGDFDTDKVKKLMLMKR